MSTEFLAKFLHQQDTQRVVVLTDDGIDALYPHYLDEVLQPFETRKFVVPTGETNKTIEQAIALWQDLLDHNDDKNLTIVNFGGGMICDLGGFVAATYKRGVHCINYPTTLLAMIDAAIGGKTAVDFHHIKNCVGVVRQPDFVVPADLELLKTLPHQELLSGFGEMIKYALISSRELFEQLCQLGKVTPQSIQAKWIEDCVRYKKHIVDLDPEDKNERHVLNFGHTFGHAFESYYASIGEPIPHGVAVAIGLLYECQYAVQQGILPRADFQRIDQLIRKHYVVPELTDTMRGQLKPYIAQDKKVHNGQVETCLISAVGRPGMYLLDIDC